MKLSSLKVGDILEITTRLFPIYFVLTNEVFMEHRIEGDQRRLLFFTIRGYKIIKRGPKEKFDLNRITPDEVLKDEYAIENCRIYPQEHLPLLINENNKTIWFERIFKGEIKDTGRQIYPILKECVEKYSVIN